MTRILIGAALAIACTAALDAAGYTAFSALPLIPLFALFAWLDRITRAELGLTRGKAGHYALALGHPLAAMGALALLAFASGAIDFAGRDPGKVVANVALLGGVTFVMAIITEEGFFRGWLWAALSRRGASAIATLIATTAAFALWHVSFVFLSAEFHFAPASIPLFFVNVTLLGLVWGLLRLGSGSIVVSSAGHGLWNGLAYVLFGVGSTPGALGIQQLELYGPEVGLYGVILNAAAAAALFWFYREKLAGTSRSPES